MNKTWLLEQEALYLDLQLQMQNPEFYQSEAAQESL